MLTRIENVNGVGLLHQANGAAHKLDQVAFIYAGNGRGKSTISSVLRSLALNDAQQVTSRRTIDGTNDQLIKLQFESGQRATFQNGSWDCSRPELLVFDSQFIDRNVYSGVAVTSEHRRNLLDFAIGDRAVAARQDEETAVEQHRTAASEISRLTGLVELLSNGMTVAAFEQLDQIDDLAEKREALIRRKTDATRADAILRQALPSRLTTIDLNLDELFDILRTELADIEASAESLVSAHIAGLNGSNGEEWISEGIEHQDGDECPFCSQTTAGIELVRMYRTYFNRDFLTLKARIRDGISVIGEATRPELLERVEQERASINEQITSWTTHVSHESLTNEGDQLLSDSLDALRTLLGELFALKAEHPGESIGDNELQAEAQAILDQAGSTIHDQNEVLAALEVRITDFKTALSDTDMEAILKEIAALTLVEVRHRPDTIELLDKLKAARSALAAAERGKREARERLTGVMSATLDTYRVSINSILSNMGAAFSIERLRNNYLGGTARSEYEISLRGQSVPLTGGEPSFETALSEGDKRSLAFAFFVASTLADPSLSTKTVVIDDPVSSLDRHRRENTIELLKQIADSSEQLVVLAHDAIFLRSLRDALNRPSARPISEMQIHRVAGGYSDFAKLDLDRECETPFYTHYRTVDEFISGATQDARGAATALRPLLEGHLHRRFPGLIAEGKMLGPSITDIGNAVAPSPLAHMAPWIVELRALNAFAGRFHHDTNTGFAAELVDEASVLAYGERVMNVVHGGRVPN